MPLVSLRSKAGGEVAAALAALRTGLPAEFPPEVVAEAQAAVRGALLPDEDLTATPFLTLDPAGATDLDQAFHIARAGGGFSVLYAIADVPAFVAAGGAIDAEARRRGQTVYAPGGRIPLHPTVISEGAASLLEGQLRGAFVWSFELDRLGKVTDAAVRRARIRSTWQGSYDEAQARIDAGNDGMLALLREVGELRIALERERGGASLNRPEQEIVEDGGHYRLVRRTALPVEGWNAQLSLMTGMAAAEMMLGAGVGILRTMPAPDDGAIEAFRIQVAALGRVWAPGVAYGEYLRTLPADDPATPAVIQAAAKLFRGAGYTVIDGPVAPAGVVQAAIGAPYAHVTAPLRRLVDRFGLLVCEAVSQGRRVPAWVTDALPSLPEIMVASGRVASQLENAAIAIVEAAVLADRVGEPFEAVVVSANDTHGVIQLEDPAVTARCDGVLKPGEHVTATLVTADIATGTVLFSA